MSVTCRLELDSKTQQLCTVATICTPNDRRRLENKARKTLPMHCVSYCDDKIIMTFAAELDSGTVAEALGISE